MNHLPHDILERANREAIYNLYLYLACNYAQKNTETLASIVSSLETQNHWSARETYRLHILRNAIHHDRILADSKLMNLTCSESGMTACIFLKPLGDVSIIFKGTGNGEWLDNGEGLSGIPSENGYATDQQVEALDWFLGHAKENGWDAQTNITVSGHSKGGNKAQFVAMHSDLVDACYSFSGQGFSPEALIAFKKQHGEDYRKRQQKMYSFATDNDYVNVLGNRLVPKHHIYYFESAFGFHYPEAILNITGRLRPQSEQGDLSKYVETISKELMKLKPLDRQYITLGVMSLIQKYVNEEKKHHPNSDTFSNGERGI